jgi:hypothetical protein
VQSIATDPTCFIGPSSSWEAWFCPMSTRQAALPPSADGRADEACGAGLRLV